MSSNNFFSFSFAKTLFRRNWYQPGMYLILWLVIMGSVFRQNGLGGIAFPEAGFEELSMFGVFVTFGYALVSVGTNFDFLFNKPSADYHASMPLSRTCLLLSTYAVVLVPALLANLVVFAGCAYADLQTASDIIRSVHVLVTISALLLINTALCLLCATATGSRGLYAVLCLMLNGYAFAVSNGVSWASEMFSFGIPYSGGSAISAFVWFSPMAKVCEVLVSSSVDSLDGRGALVLGVYCVVALAALAAAVQLFRMRRMERSGDGEVFKKAHVVLSLAFSLAFGLGFALFRMTIVGDFSSTGAEADVQQGVLLADLIGSMLVGALVSYAVLETSVQRSLKVLRKRIPHFAALAVLCVMLALGCLQYGKFVTNYVPDVSQVASVEARGLACSSKDPEVIEQVARLHKGIVDAYNSKTMGAQGLLREIPDGRGIDEYGNVFEAGDERTTAHVDMNIVYRMKDGSTVTRYYSFWLNKSMLEDSSSLAAKTMATAQSEAVRKTRVEGLRFRAKAARDPQQVAFLEWDDGVGATFTKALNEEQFLNLMDQALADEIMAGCCDPGWTKDVVSDKLLAGRWIHLEMDYTLRGSVENMGYRIYPLSVELAGEYAPQTVKWISENLNLDKPDVDVVEYPGRLGVIEYDE